MTSRDKADISLADLSLEPMESEVLPIAAPQPGQSHAHSRSKTRTDRRVVVVERREVIRFQDDRRSGKERRPKRS